MLDANAAEDGMQVVCDVARRVDVGRAGPTALVDQHTVGLREGLPREGRHRGLDPDAGHDEVASHAETSRGHDRLDPLGSLEPSYLIPVSQLDTLLSVDCGDHCAELLA